MRKLIGLKGAGRMPTRSSSSPNALGGYSGQDIGPLDTLAGLLRSEAGASVVRFRARIAELQSVGRGSGLDDDTTLLLINKGFADSSGQIRGLVWDSIPWGLFDEVVDFVRCNARRAYAIIWGDSYITNMADSGRGLRETISRIGMRIPEQFQ